MTKQEANMLPPISEEELATRQPKRRIGCVAMGLVALVSFTTIAFVAVFLWNVTSSRRLNEALAKLAAAGYPTTVADLKTTYQVPTGTNPGPLWIEAGKGLDAKDANVKKLPYLGSEGVDPPMPGEKWQQLAAAKAYLQKHAAELKTIERVAGLRAQSRYATTFEHHVSQNPSDVDARTPYVRSHRQICRVMSMPCYVHAHECDTESVVKSITNGLRAAQSLADEPQMMGHVAPPVLEPTNLPKSAGPLSVRKKQGFAEEFSRYRRLCQSWHAAARCSGAVGRFAFVS